MWIWASTCNDSIFPMKKIVAFAVFLVLTISGLSAQSISYGIMLGANFNNIEIDGEGLRGGASHSAFKEPGVPIDLGGYVDFQLNESMGIKANVFYSKTLADYTLGRLGYTSERVDWVTSSVEVQPLFKYDVNKSYGKGFYLLAGPRLAFVFDQKDVRNNLEGDDFYKSVNFGANLGFGFTVSELIGFEITGNYGLSNLIDSSHFESTTAGAYANLYFNLDKLIND